MLCVLFLLALDAGLALPAHPPLISPIVTTVTGYDLVARTDGNSSLWKLTTTDKWALGPALLLDLRGRDRFSMGRDYASLLASVAVPNLAGFFDLAVPNATQRALLFSFLDWQWAEFMTPHIPREFLEEMRGIAAESQELGSGAIRMIVLAVGPADEDNWQIIVDSECPDSGACPFTAAQLSELVYILGHLFDEAPGGRRSAAFSCDMFAVWGPRVAGGSLLSSRNLDWVIDSGVSTGKLVTVYHPPEAGRHAHATVGFAGFPGAIAGMSAAGLTVSQSNLDNSRVTMAAASWPFRLRYLMETAAEVADVRAVYSAGAQAATAGSANHVVAAQADAAAGRSAAVAAECFAPSNALFSDNDPAEANATYEGQRIGFPLPHALWRTNHALSAALMPTQVPLWNDTLQRYDMMRQFILDAVAPPAAAGINESYATAIAATLGQKGADYYTCGPDYAGGEHVISVVYNPAEQRLLAAWEDGTGPAWTPAACTFYAPIELGAWW